MRFKAGPLSVVTMHFRSFKAVIAFALALFAVTNAQAQSADEIFEATMALSDELETARKDHETAQVCSLALTIIAEHLVARRLLLKSAERALERVEDNPTEDELTEISKELGGNIAVTDLLAKLSGRAEMACELMSQAK